MPPRGRATTKTARTKAAPRRTRRRRSFPGISPLAWQHPADLEALEAVRRVPALDQVIQAVSEHWYEQAFLVDSVGSRLRVGPKQAPKVWALFREAADTLDLATVPEVFLTTHGTPNAFAFGMKRYSITLHSSLVDMLTEDELLAVIGHELSHIKCQHMLYRSLALMLARFSASVLTGVLGLGRVAILPLQLSLLAWSRWAELSCDRGALLVVQDGEAVARSLAKLAGWSRSMGGDVDLEEVYRQGEEYEKVFDEKLVTKAFKTMRELGSTHPVPIWRAKTILDWSESGQYADILAGHYLNVRQARDGKRVNVEGPHTPARCVACGHGMERIFVFCPSCGATVDEALRPCGACGKSIEVDWSTCPHCGKVA